jgi:hypothetical protein
MILQQREAGSISTQCSVSSRGKRNQQPSGVCWWDEYVRFRPHEKGASALMDKETREGVHDWKKRRRGLLARVPNLFSRHNHFRVLIHV